MTAPFLALITPLGDGSSPPGINYPTFPTNPIVVPPGGAYPQPPLQIWGGPWAPGFSPGTPPPRPQPGPWPGSPQHPIYDPGLGIWGGSGSLPQPPLGTWGGGNVPFPTPPIYFPPEGGGAPPLGTWGGGNVPFPTPPIHIPPDTLPPTIEERPIDWKVGWTPTTGWIVVGIPTGPTPTPSK
jgi:hypothetical protein